MTLFKNILSSLKRRHSGRSDNNFSGNWKAELGKYSIRKVPKTFFLTRLIRKLRRSQEIAQSKGYSNGSANDSLGRKLGLKLLQGLVSLALITGGFFFLKTPTLQLASEIEFFKIKEVSIYGSTLIRKAELKKIIGVDYNTSMFMVDAAEAEEALETNPWIRDARLKKIWPNNIVVEVSEQKACALMVMGTKEDGKLVYLNANGEPFANVSPGDELDFPVVTGFDKVAEQERERAASDIVEFLALIGKNNPNLPAQSVSEIHFDPEEGMVIRLVDFPFPIFFGKGEVKKKYKQLRRVLAVLYKKQNDKVDIRNIEYIRMDYFTNKVLVAQSDSG